MTTPAGPVLDSPPLRILVVDDDEFDRRAVRRCLLQSGLRAAVDEAGSANEVLEHIELPKYDCILLDYYLPDADGLTLLDRIRITVPEMPVVIFTGRGDEEIAVEMMKAGAVDYLPKASLTPERLASSLRHAMELARSATARRRTEEDLRAQEARFRTLANAIPQLAWMADANGWRYWYNHRWLDYTGTTLEQVQGWGWQQFHHPEHVERVTAIVRQSSASGEPWEATFPLRGKDGEYRWFLTRALPIRGDDDTISGWVGTSTDITDRQEAEAERERLLARAQEARAEAEAALRMHNAVASFATHDLRTPLTTIKGQAQMLRRLAARDRLTPEILIAGLTGIDDASRSMEALIGELLDAVRVRSGQEIDLRCEPTDLVELAHRCVAQQQQTTDRHTLHVIARDPSVAGEWDPIRLERVVNNLLNNAIKYSPDGGAITVTVGHEQNRPGTWADLSVQDEGMGIPGDDLPYIFERFYRGANVTRQFEGSGIGLAGVRQIVEQHGGTITVDSVESRGSTFTVRLPVPAEPMDAGRGDDSPPLPTS
jgi:PAS domain S-box-containing protein